MNTYTKTEAIALALCATSNFRKMAETQRCAPLTLFCSSTNSCAVKMFHLNFGFDDGLPVAFGALRSKLEQWFESSVNQAKHWQINCRSGGALKCSKMPKSRIHCNRWVCSNSLFRHRFEYTRMLNLWFYFCLRARWKYCHSFVLYFSSPATMHESMTNNSKLMCNAIRLSAKFSHWNHLGFRGSTRTTVAMAAEWWRRCWMLMKGNSIAFGATISVVFIWQR